MKFIPLIALFVMVLCSSCLELDTGTKASASGASPSRQACDTNDSSLVACFQFEDNATDESKNHSPTTPVAMTYADGIVGRAASFDGMTSQVTLPDAAYRTMPQFTIELWYYQRSYSPVRMGLIDGDNRFGAFIHGPGDLRCSRGAEYFIVSQGLP